MVDANEKDEALKSNLSPEKDVAQEEIVPSNILSTPIMNSEKTVAASGITDNMEDENDEEEEEEWNEEEEEEEEDEEQEEEGEQQNVNDGVDRDKEQDKEKVNDEETNKENAVKIDANKGEDEKKDENKGEDEKKDENKGEDEKKAENKGEDEKKAENKGEDEKKAEEPKNGEELGGNSKKKRPRPRNRNRKKAEEKSSGTLAVNGDKPESSSKKNASKRVESMGMVFMCSSKTKTDCFRYKILGLPGNKKDQVAKIYKGMRLFLFDVDLRLMYGIFKAAGPGGYNIEPKAFKSDFPSQVRFTVLEDCLPLAEENFKDVIKENYYTRNKFEGLLKAEQVKKLCKLFVLAGRGPRNKPAIKPRITRAVENLRIRPEKTRRSGADDSHTSRVREKRKRQAREDDRHPRPRSRSPPGREKRRYTDYERPHVLYGREPPAVPRYLPLPPPAAASPVRLYTYERPPLDIHPYTRDRVPEHHTYRVRDVEPRDRDPYHVYGREAPTYRDAVYTVPPEYHLVSREYHPPAPAVQTADYRHSRVPTYRDVEPDYRSSAPSLPEYGSHRTHYRY